MNTAVDDDVSVQVAHLTKRFGDRYALDDVSVSIPRGCVTGIVGPNGSGKSTMLSCVVGIQPVTSGTITVEGHPVGSDEARRVLCFSPDDLPMPDLLTGTEYLKLVCELERRRHDIDRAVELAGLFGISGSLNKLVGAYSHGMRRRLQFAATLSSPAAVLLMDEPFSGLDVEGVYLLRSALADWRDAGRTALVTIHDLRSAERECDLVVVLSNGRLVAAGRPADLIARGVESLEDLVLDLSGTLDNVRENAQGIRALVLDGADASNGTDADDELGTAGAPALELAGHG